MTSKKLKIAIVIQSFTTAGGAERYAVEIGRRMRDRGHEVHLFALFKDDVQSKGMHFHPVPNKWNFSSVLNSRSFAAESTRLLRGMEFDVVHSHENGLNHDLFTIHTFSYISGLSKYSFIRRLDQRYLSLRSWIYLWMEKRKMQSPWLVAVSEVIREDIEKYYQRKQNVVVVPPGVDTDVFNAEWIQSNRLSLRKKKGIGDKETVILFVGSEFRRKGLDNLIPAIGEDMRLFVVGKGERYEHYTKLAEQSGVKDRVHFEGFAEENVRNYYAIADVVVLPSLSEAFGMTVLEGMACGLPVVVNQAAGASAVISHGDDGFVFDEPKELTAILAADRYEEIYFCIAEEKNTTKMSLKS